MFNLTKNDRKSFKIIKLFLFELAYFEGFECFIKNFGVFTFDF